ncbi:MAG: BlaI/MecI/CopY family transcriptional regulator [Phycisphaerales bacterium]|nr:BlaI/MecI/CopY family transcriptional regulator [Phycisphaerales bacterium]MCB9855016.1 BlaI/MecI/CopY family transcriptional regulator [Phycisphaerales bacterium]MCB9863467.1 BlaI/MecI/CopY family transcriptional regulator [Phycisphaerales bacterium]
MGDKSQELSAAELEVLRVLWDAGPSTVRQVLDALRSRGRDWAYTTVLTFLTRMEQKGVVSSNKSGLAYVYRPALTRNRVRRERLRLLVDELYDGAAGPLVLQLLKSQRLNREDIEALQKLIDELDDKSR